AIELTSKMSSAIPSLLFCLLLLAPQLGSSYHTSSNSHSGRHVVLRSSHDSRVPPSCPPVHSGDDDGGPLPVMHRRSACTPSSAGLDQSKPSVRDTFDRDALRLSTLFGKSGVTIPSTGTPLAALPGASEYHVAVGFGTPVQKFHVGFDTGSASAGATLLQCKPCAGARGAPCPRAFDPSKSTSLAHVPCGSPDCDVSECRGRRCTRTLNWKNGLQNATFVTDTLTLTRSVTVDKLRFFCLEMAARSGDGSSGILDLSRDRHSLASRVAPSPATVTFSYCLPSYADSIGFLSVGAARPELAGHNVSYATLRSKALHPNLYSVQLVGFSIAGRDSKISPIKFVGDTVFELHTTFTYLRPDVYAVLREQFKGWMRPYRAAPPLGDLDTCYDFSGLSALILPDVTLRFKGGATMDLDIENLMYFEDPGNHFSVGCLAFAAARTLEPVVAVIGTLAQGMTEVVYDVLGGKVGLIPRRC
uniref:Peptidase A1 domain-containing protein n=5 Tax=Triticinae TaxID=1648030 RepID=A0A453REW5_AEGTS